MRKEFFVVIFFILISCSERHSVGNIQDTPYNHQVTSKTSLIVLGTVQDGGSPHIGCSKSCCSDLFKTPDINRQVVSLGIIDTQYKKTFIIEATPDFPFQIKTLKNLAPFNSDEMPDAIFITHAHIGHYSGLMYLGKEAKNAENVPVYVMPRMKSFLENNGPWNQLVINNNIKLFELQEKTRIALTPNVHIVPVLVPHRDEYSETVGFKIFGPEKSALFIPDIDKWEKWELDIIKEIEKVDYSFLDATFFDEAEINYRDISQIPHPFVIESMDKFKNLSPEEKNKIFFIHFNHTNPLLDSLSKKFSSVKEKGYNVSKISDILNL